MAMAFAGVDWPDWRQLWVDRHGDKADSSDPAEWNARAKAFAAREVSPYTRTFVEFLELEPGESVLDMGCGSGDIAVILAAAGHPVLAADFSSEMLKQLELNRASKGVDGIEARLMSWTDDWTACGIGPKSVDVAYASRSCLVGDITIVLDKLTATARRRAALTLCSGSTPKEDATLVRAIGRAPRGELDLAICFNLLWERGLQPSVRYIPGDKRYGYATPDEAVEASLARIPDLTPAEHEAGEAFVRAHLVDTGAVGDPARYVPGYRTCSDWAFVSWSVDACGKGCPASA